MTNTKKIETQKKHIIKNPIWRNVVAVLLITVLGFILFNVTFLFDAAYQGIVRRIVMIFIQMGPESNFYWFPIVMHGSFLVILLLISWLVLRTKWRPLIKAIFITQPAATVLATTGIILNHWPAAVYSVGAVIVAASLFIFYRMKLSWIYYYAVIFVALTLSIFTLMGGEI
ncbi:MAG: hypothetical protein WC752_02620 [Patescibacteria group bacterium]|jgi:hypothetical protein